MRDLRVVVDGQLVPTLLELQASQLARIRLIIEGIEDDAVGCLTDPLCPKCDAKMIVAQALTAILDGPR